jgi:methionyl-tRNA synthetase
MNKKGYYVTTPIYYPSGNLHIGHAYSTTIADVLKRVELKLGNQAYFLTGSDEHGQKIQEKAQEAKISEIEYLNKNVDEFKKLWKILKIDYNQFIRTTDPEHIKSIQKIFSKMLKNKDIYLGSYEGWYSVSDETYYPENQIVDPIRDDNKKIIGGKSPESGHQLELIKEECYFFNVKKYAKWLEETLLTQSILVPEERVNEIINSFLKDGVEDLAISRTTFNWGIKINENPRHVVYVWLDALFNYITALGYDADLSFENQTELFKKFWPADVQIVGKEIIRFHGMYWLIFLKSLELPLPKKIYAHGWIMSSGEKMSKSKGNVIDPISLSKIFGVDYLRLFLLYEYPLKNDGNFTFENFVERYNSLLANDLGNMISRTAGMVENYLDGQLHPIEFTKAEIIELDNSREKTLKEFLNLIKKLEFSQAIKKVFSLIDSANKIIDFLKPWELNKEGDTSTINELLVILHEITVDVVNMLEPIMPSLVDELKLTLQIEQKDFKFNLYKLVKVKKISKIKPIYVRTSLTDSLDKIND